MVKGLKWVVGLSGVGTGGDEIFRFSGHREGNDFAQSATAPELGPVFQNRLGASTAGFGVVLNDHGVQPFVIDIGAVDHGNASGVKLGGYRVMGIINK